MLHIFQLYVPDSFFMTDVAMHAVFSSLSFVVFSFRYPQYAYQNHISMPHMSSLCPHSMSDSSIHTQVRFRNHSYSLSVSLARLDKAQRCKLNNVKLNNVKLWMSMAETSIISLSFQINSVLRSVFLNWQLRCTI